MKNIKFFILVIISGFLLTACNKEEESDISDFHTKKSNLAALSTEYVESYFPLDQGINWHFLCDSGLNNAAEVKGYFNIGDLEYTQINWSLDIIGSNTTKMFREENGAYYSPAFSILSDFNRFTNNVENVVRFNYINEKQEWLYFDDNKVVGERWDYTLRNTSKYSIYDLETSTNMEFRIVDKLHSLVLDGIEYKDVTILGTRCKINVNLTNNGQNLDSFNFSQKIYLARGIGPIKVESKEDGISYLNLNLTKFTAPE